MPLTRPILPHVYRTASCFKWLTFTLPAYIGAALFARPDRGDVLRRTFVPTILLGQVYPSMLLMIFGTAISPDMFFWQPQP